MQKSILIPTVISSIRIAVLPLLFYLYNTGNIVLCLAVFTAAAFTDLLDGFLARKLKVATRFGTYFDSTTDFVFVMGIFTFFAVKGLYSVWLLLLITAAFAQFVASSLYAKKLHDPIGRYTGSALYIGVVLTIALPSQATFTFVGYAFLGFFLLSLASRALSLKGHQMQLQST
ncbi:MAG: CDP-alcohol phosphatidyltransferase family protein [Candidatus Bathyarchaeia archaeon]|jgi:phosphatidylglycerophosphate synthase